LCRSTENPKIKLLQLLNKDHKTKHALVTGVSRGIGRAIAVKLLAEGFTVTGTHSKSAVPDELQQHPRFNAIKVDFINPAEVTDKIGPVLQSDNAPGVLINNAGIAVGFDMLDQDDAGWMAHSSGTMLVNYTIPVMLTRWVLPVWIHRQNGVLINIASRAAYRGDTGDFADYAASKAALTAFTKSVAREYSRHRITAVTIAPGFIETDMASDAILRYGRDHVMKGLAVPELTQPSDVAEVVSAVAAGRMLHITGTTIHVNGGSYLI
jgi:3-oxoacyl-[acyl-carrier protein] reductase